MFSMRFFSHKIQSVIKPELQSLVRYAGAWLTSSTNDLCYINPNSSPDKNERSIAIYCIHGTGDRVSAFKYLAEKMLPDLPEIISTIHLVTFKERGKGIGIDDFARQLADKIVTDQVKDVIFIGHSRGAIVASYVAEYLAKQLKINVHGVITIGAPFSGTALARWPFTWFSLSVQQMKKESEFLKNLVRRITYTTHHYHHIGGEYDIVVPPESSYTEKYLGNSIVLKNKGHLSMMLSPELSNHLINCLKETEQKVIRKSPFRQRYGK
ncbi:MAG: hypothetical protein A3F12_07250 [Gammaproteobacteria bacterium RIFCSPHIGHO2_12_FULL_38_14]|nr:MAG: hypothetical protein A3F12_07250 [Gammaproteobacteria bacterium RIFCSPHIGHO2_12_FULL_38_14]